MFVDIWPPFSVSHTLAAEPVKGHKIFLNLTGKGSSLITFCQPSQFCDTVSQVMNGSFEFELGWCTMLLAAQSFV